MNLVKKYNWNSGYKIMTSFVRLLYFFFGGGRYILKSGRFREKGGGEKLHVDLAFEEGSKVQPKISYGIAEMSRQMAQMHSRRSSIPSCPQNNLHS